MENKSSKLLSTISVIILVIDVIFLLCLTFMTIFTGSSFLEVYKSFKITMPAITKIALYLGPYIFIAGILILITKERLLKREKLNLIINIGVFFIIWFILSFYVGAIFKPTYDMGSLAKSSSTIEDESFDRGVDYLSANKFDEAIKEFNRVIEIDPGSGIAYSYRGFLYAKEGELVKAVFDYNKAIEINPNSAKAYGNRAVIYYDMKEYDKAWIDVHKAEGLGLDLGAGFLEALKRASGRDR